MDVIKKAVFRYEECVRLESAFQASIGFNPSSSLASSRLSSLTPSTNFQVMAALDNVCDVSFWIQLLAVVQDVHLVLETSIVWWFVCQVCLPFTLFIHVLRMISYWWWWCWTAFAEQSHLGLKMRDSICSWRQTLTIKRTINILLLTDPLILIRLLFGGNTPSNSPLNKEI